jgi:hypothetical protein
MSCPEGLRCSKKLLCANTAQTPSAGDIIKWCIKINNFEPEAHDINVVDAYPVFLVSSVTWTSKINNVDSVSGSGDIDDTWTVPAYGELEITVSATVPAFDDCLTRTFTNAIKVFASEASEL